MFRSSAKPFFGVLFVLVGTVHYSSAACSASCSASRFAVEAAQKHEYAEENPQEFEFSEDDAVTDEKLANVVRSNGFIGDLIVGKRHQHELLYNTVLNVGNSDNAVQTVNYEYKLPKGFIHYLAVSNVGRTNTVIYPIRFILGSSKARFSVRINPRSTAALNVLVAYFRW